MPRLPTRKYQARCSPYWVWWFSSRFSAVGRTPTVAPSLVLSRFPRRTCGHLHGPPARVIATLLGIPTLVGLWTGFFLPGVARVPLAVTFHLVAALFFGFTIGVILRDIHREKGVAADSVYGAFCGYLLAGLAFGNLFNVVELLAPGSFRGEDITPQMSDDRRHFRLTYFSFITLATVGYGDITPGNDAARGLAAVEAIVGQFYIAVLVAELIGKRVSQAFAPPEK